MRVETRQGLLRHGEAFVDEGFDQVEALWRQPGQQHSPVFRHPASRDQTCGLKPVSFVQELGTRNQHPGYGSAYVGDEQIAAALRSIYEGPCADDTLTIVTYDEFGGAWDHVPPPGQGPTTKGAHDEFGPGTRVPTLIVSNGLPRSGVDSTTYDLASVIGTITAKFGLKPINRRDSEQATIWTAWSALRK